MEGYTYYLYESKENLELANKFINMYTPCTAAERFFENSNISNNNQHAANNSVSHLKKAIAAIRGMISKIIETVTTFFQTAFMGKDEKNKFLRFKEAMKNNPEFANKKVTVKDFREINKRYQDALKVMDDGIVAVQREKSEKAGQIADAVCKKAQNIVKGLGDSSKAIFSVDTALRMAEGNRNVAKWIKSQLEKENGVMNYIESELGKERAQDFKNKINSSTKLLSMHRLKVMILGQYHNTASGALNQVISDFETLLNPKMDTTTNIKRATQMRIVDDAIGSFNSKTGSNVTKRGIVKAGLSVKREVDGAKKSVENAKKKREKAAKNKKRKDVFRKGIDNMRKQMGIPDDKDDTKRFLSS